MSADLSGLTIGSLTLTPTFSPDVTEYTATTANASNKVTATTDDATARIKIMLGETEVTNGSSVTWAAGENELTVTVTDGDVEKTYTVTVTKSE